LDKATGIRRGGKGKREAWRNWETVGERYLSSLENSIQG